MNRRLGVRATPIAASVAYSPPAFQRLRRRLVQFAATAACAGMVADCVSDLLKALNP